ncbi:MAG: hypothetical protein QOE22_93 [Candidatus Parcubacteria bacterium]|jgi:hypothetical protein|nr:hypothetical protein [Candidatus Parcubacteria bacterium]
MNEKKIGRFRASYLLAAESFEFLRKDKEMLWVPLMSCAASFILAAAVIGLGFTYILMFENVSPQTDDAIFYVFLFLFYIGATFIFTFFQGVIAAMVHIRVGGGDPMLSDGLANSLKRTGKIFRWSVVAATVGVVLNLIQEKLGWLGRILGFAGSVAWSVLTFFMVPVLVLEEGTIKGSLERSGRLFREAWGETLVMNFSLSLFFTALHLVWIVLCGVIVFFSADSLAALIPVGIAFLAGFILLAVVGSVLSAIFKTVLYEYASSGRVPDTFTPELIMGAVKKKGA